MMSNNAKQANYICNKKVDIWSKNTPRNTNLRYCYNKDLPRLSSFTIFLQYVSPDNNFLLLNRKEIGEKNKKDDNILTVKRYGKIHILCKINVSSPPHVLAGS